MGEDITSVTGLLLWLRERGIHVGELTVGSVTLSGVEGLVQPPEREGDADEDVHTPNDLERAARARGLDLSALPDL